MVRMATNLNNMKNINIERCKIYFLALGFSLIEYSIPKCQFKLERK